MIDSIKQFDQDMLLFLNSLQADWLDKPILVITSTPFQGIMVLLFIFLLYRRFGWKVSLLSLGGIGLVVLLADMISVHCFKEVFERYRPTHNLDIGNLVQTVKGWDGKPYLGGKFGFVSSHATNLFGMATFLFFQGKKWPRSPFILLLIWPALVSYTRIYLGVHYPLDIICGAILGIAIGYIVYLVASRVSIRLKLKTELS